MGIGADVNEVLEENGTSITIYKTGGAVVTGEYVDYETSFDSSTEFIRQFTLSASVMFDTQMSQGDTIELGGDFYVVMNLKPERFEGEVVENGGFLLQCNTYGTFMRKAVNPTRDENYEITDAWLNVRTLVHGVMYENIRGSVTDEVENLFQAPADMLVLITSGFTDLKEGDRWVPDPSVPDVFYRVVKILTNKYVGSNYMVLEEDTRE